MNESIVELLNTTTSQVPFLDRIFTNTSLAHRLLERLTLTNLRHAFYLVSPYETAVDTLDQVPNYNIEVSTWWFIFITVEFLILAISRHDDRFALNDSITSIHAGMMSQIFKFGGRAIAIFPYVWIWNNCRLLELPWDSPWTWILCLFFQDFMYYLGHRAVHEAGFLWAFHNIHHSSEYYNYSTALRQAMIQDSGLAAYDCLQAFFIPPPIFLVHRYFSEIFQFLMHTSLFGSFGPLGYVFNTPSHHRVHHGRNPYCIDKNYGGVFIIWDRMFNTFAAERPDDPPIYGLVHNEASFNQLWLQFHILYDVLIKKWQWKDEKGEPIFKTFADKIRATVFPIGWIPGVPVQPFFHWMTMVDPAYGVPEPQKPVVKYNPPLAAWTKMYLLGHFVIFLAVFFHFEYDRSHLTDVGFFVKFAYFVLTMQCYGAFFDKRSFAPVLEIVRCCCVLGFYSILILDHIGPGAHRVFMISVHVISALLWTSFLIQELITKRNRIAAQEASEKPTKAEAVAVQCEEQKPGPLPTL